MPKRLGVTKLESEATRIMVFGTFDIVHPGHLHFFKQARALANHPYLIVSIARDVNVKRIKGTLPIHNERQRAALVKYSGMVDKVVLGGLKDHVSHIKKERPKIIALGHDQDNEYTKDLLTKLERVGQVVSLVKLKPHGRDVFKTSIYKNAYGKKKI